ncbi:MAG: hypothetical protein RL385_930 [Pseudomonadota bacterium]|jgi:hypothetical protein
MWGETGVRRHARGSLLPGTWADVDGQGLRVQNFSAGGVLLCGPCALRKGDVAEIHLRLPARDLRMLGTVVRSESDAEGRRTAFEFVDSSPDEMALLSGTVEVSLHAPRRLGQPRFTVLDPGRQACAALMFSARALECGVDVFEDAGAALESLRASPHPVFGVVATHAADPSDVMDVFVHALRYLPFVICALYSNVCRPSAGELARLGAQTHLHADGLERAMARLLIDAQFRHDHRPGLGLR